MGNRGVSNISKSGASLLNHKAILTSAGSTDQPDEKNVCIAEVTKHVEEVGRTENGTILLKQLLVS